MKSWSRGVVRLIGALNLVYFVLGLVLLIEDIVRAAPTIQNSMEFPYERTIYVLMTSISGFFLVGLMFSGYWLLRLLRRGVVLSNFVFSLEILYFLLSDLISLFMIMSANRVAKSIGLSLANVNGDAGISLQIITCYPLIALIVLNIARRRMNRDGNWKLAPAKSS
ncbi:MAG TPA: hypothetical protein VEH50_12645 [Methylomirabilota bacterium]|nr:hypothetical protein [Methylomirabilota bacterium]